MLAAVDGLEVVGTAADGAEAVARAAALAPDVVVMDVRMPALDGIASTRRVVVDADPAVGVVVLTMSEQDETLFAAMRAGARGYLLKGRPGRRSSSRSRPSRAFPGLTTREREVLDLVAAGRRRSSAPDAGMSHL